MVNISLAMTAFHPSMDALKEGQAGVKGEGRKESERGMERERRRARGEKGRYEAVEDLWAYLELGGAGFNIKTREKFLLTPEAGPEFSQKTPCIVTDSI
jgi:hypothetical protein